MLDTDIIMRAIRKENIDNIIDCAMDTWWKVIDEFRKVIFSKGSERVSLYFQDDDKSILLRWFLWETTTEPMSATV